MRTNSRCSMCGVSAVCVGLMLVLLATARAAPKKDTATATATATLENPYWVTIDLQATGDIYKLPSGELEGLLTKALEEGYRVLFVDVNAFHISPDVEVEYVQVSHLARNLIHIRTREPLCGYTSYRLRADIPRTDGPVNVAIEFDPVYRSPFNVSLGQNQDTLDITYEPLPKYDVKAEYDVKVMHGQPSTQELPPKLQDWVKQTLEPWAKLARPDRPHVRKVLSIGSDRITGEMHVDTRFKPQPSEEAPSRNSMRLSWERFVTDHSDVAGTIRASILSVGLEADQKADTINVTAGWKWQSYPWVKPGLDIRLGAELSQELKGDTGFQPRATTEIVWDPIIDDDIGFHLRLRGWYNPAGPEDFEGHLEAELSHKISDNMRFFVRHTGGAEPPKFTDHSETIVGIGAAFAR